MTDQYLLAGSAVELERLRLQARVWEPEAEAMLDRIGVPPGARCIDLGCGGMGILGPLSHRAGPSGQVIGLDTDARQLTAARAYLGEFGLTNVTVEERDIFATGLPRASFDLVHARFEFAPLGRDDELLREMLALARPGGVVAIQEPDAAAWQCYPPNPAWDHLKSAILEAFARGGGDFNAGRRTYGMLRRAGLEDVRVRAAVLALQNGHPYMRLIVQFAASLRARILAAGLMTEAALDDAVAACGRLADDPDTCMTTFVLVQTWGRVPTG